MAWPGGGAELVPLSGARGDGRRETGDERHGTRLALQGEPADAASNPSSWVRRNPASAYQNFRQSPLATTGPVGSPVFEPLAGSMLIASAGKSFRD